MIVVSNAGPLIALARIGRLALMPALFGTVTVPEAVYGEVAALEPEERAGQAALREAPWLEVDAVTDVVAVSLLRDRLDLGESEAIVLALERRADVLLIDEARGRRLATARGVAVTGTLGLLLLAKARGHVARVAPALDALSDQGFHMSGDLRRAVLEQAGEV